MTALLRRFATRRGRWVLAALFVVFTFVLFPLSPPGDGVKTLDGRIRGHAPEDAYKLLAGYDEGARRGYAVRELTLDVGYPVIYSLLLWSLLTPLLHAAGAGRWLFRCRYLPFAAALADLCENVTIVLMISRLAERPPLLAGVARVATVAKWFLLAAALLLLIWCSLRWIVGRRSLSGMPELIGLLGQYAYLVRVPLLGAAALLALAFLGGGNVPTIVNMMLVDTCWGVAAATFLVLVTGVLCGFTGILIWDLATERFGVTDLPLPRLLGRRDVLRAAPFALLGLPLIVRLAKSSATPPNGSLGPWTVVAGVLLGFVVAAVLVAGVEAWRRLFLGWPASRPDRQDLNVQERPDGQDLNFLERLARLVGPGYWDSTQQRVQPGHPLTLSTVVVTALVYAWGYFKLRPDNAHFLPTLAYVLALIFLLTLILAGATFFFDRFRIPLLLVLVVYSVGLNAVNPRDHFFAIAREGGELPPKAVDAVAARLERQRSLGTDQPVLTVVLASGGGIQAAAWTAQVLTGLQDVLGEEFSRSIHLVSSVSGGSVGAYYFLEGFDKDRCAPRQSQRGLAAIRQAAMGSSLEATAWGLAYPDFLRTFLPLPLDPRLDRAWAIEQAWLRHSRQMKDTLRKDGTHLALAEEPSWLSGLRAEAGRGRLPGVVFNATFVDDGQQLYASNLDFSFLEKNPEPEPHLRVTDPALGFHYPGLNVDMRTATAARLSATFAYVTPVARARFENGEGDGKPPAYHVADGGYFDNFGTVAAVQWLRHVLESHADRIAKVVVIEIRAFPPTDPEPPKEDKGLVYAIAGPLVTVLAVRNSTQVARSEIELSLLEELENRPSTAGKIVRVPLRPPLQKDRPDPPLSWHLSREDKQRVCLDWLKQEDKVKVLYEYFPSGTHRWPAAEDCLQAGGD